MAKQKSGRALVALAVCFLLSGTLALTLFPAPRYSPTENRMLAAAPIFTRTSLASGDYTAAWDRFASERFPARGVLRHARAAIALGLFEGEVGGVVLCRDGSLSRRVAVSEPIYRQNLAALARLTARFADAAVPLVAAIIPRRIEARAEVLPPLYAADEPDVWQMLGDAAPHALALTDCTADACWYRTDHHLTSEGAYFVYCRIAAALGITPLADFSQQTVSQNFLGTSDAAAGIPFIRPDRITLYRYTGDGNYRVTRDGAPADFAGLYDMEKLQTRDQYAVFLGGNCGVLTVDLGESDARPTLLLIRDSFADALIPFLARHFRIVAVDPRYCKEGLDGLIPSADRALVLCGMQSICATPFFAPLLRK